ncbi:hypothetical protein DWX43_13725 [Clostridium sp. AF19-22AC]|jgi:hypothetical protein|uniref:hypothetical protein n=1 Tax=Clostridia TaxID=186801 RepID=UPI000E551C81|nr:MULTISPECIES: hypothetical protein [Clostridia]RHR27550.1 hypothetical protein DWX43_13725 [Clostridium sp. AF19-22AC]
MNKLKLGKKKILGFVTAGAIVVTMAGSYAAWDQLTATSKTTLTIGKAISLDLVSGKELSYDAVDDNARVWGDTAPTYTSKEVQFQAENLPTEGANITLTPSLAIVTPGNDDSVTADDFTVKVIDGTTNNPVGTEAQEFSADKTYKVVVTPENAKASSAKVQVTLDATLSEKTTP